MIPFLIMAIASSAILNQFEKLEKHLVLIKRIGGGLIVIMGLLLMTNQLTALTVFFEKLFN
jgi:cytochrome c-type biogenesis protein